MSTINGVLSNALSQLQTLQDSLKKSGASDATTSAFAQALAAAEEAAKSAQQTTGSTAETTTSTTATTAAKTAGTAHLLTGQANEDTANKPNIKEFMDVTGTDFETASDVLYGTIGSNKDLRDWKAIMASSNPLADARASTAAMYNTTGSTSLLATAPESNKILAKAGHLEVVDTTEDTPRATPAALMILTDAQGKQLTSFGNTDQLNARMVNFGFDAKQELSNMTSTIAHQYGKQTPSDTSATSQMDFVMNTIISQMKYQQKKD